MDQAIISVSNKNLAKAHVDFLGSYLETLGRISSKGVHATVDRVEAVKAVLHTYLAIGDLLKYLPAKASVSTSVNINTASLDEIESLLGVSRSIAKEIVKMRVAKGGLAPADFKNIKGIGPAMAEAAGQIFSFNKSTS